jgi:transcriptional regulator with XRE-family HTH domain
MRFFIVQSKASRIRNARIKKGMSQQELGDAVGTTQQTINNLENKDVENSKYYRSIAEALEMDFDYLMDGDLVRKKTADQLDTDEIINISVDSLRKAIGSVKAINIQRGFENNCFDEQMLLRAFELTIKGTLTGDYVTAALQSETELDNKVK